MNTTGSRSLLIPLLVLAGAHGRLMADEPFGKSVAPFLKEHCVGCHGPQKQESQLRLDQLQGFENGQRHLWTMVHEKVAGGSMPPKTRAQPGEAAKKSLLAWIEQQQRATRTDGTRRLNRREVSAALRDLTGLAVDYAHALPGDGTVAGFDTGAEGLQDAADGVAQWLRVSRRAVDGIRFLEPPPGKPFAVNLREAKDPRKAIDEWKSVGITVKGYGPGRTGMGVLLEPRAVGERETLQIGIPAPASRQGVLRLSLVVSTMKPLDGLPDPQLWVAIGGKDVDFRAITGSLDRPQRLAYEVQLDDLAIGARTVNIHLSNKVEIPYAVKGFENEDRSNPKDAPPDGTGLFRPAFDRRALPAEKQPAPFIVLQSIEIEPQSVAAWPPAAWKADADPIADDSACADRLLAVWIERAWRRPTAATERAPFVKLYHQFRKDGLSFDNALRGAFQSVLLSASFRYLTSPSHSDPGIAQHAIASRLSFMLVGEPPDAELRRLAAEGKLRDPAVLDAQVDRLLADPRSQGFVRPFVMQWLEMEQPITIAQSHIQKQDFRFARYLKASMREETLAYVGQLIAEDRPARELVVSDWTMMNDALALHYGYDPLEGGRLRPVKLRGNDPRGGGILGQAGIQSMLCWMGDNWVIYRGAWTLRHVLDHPPPPPPLEVPELNPSEGGNKGKPFRELLRRHQQDNRCNVCHRTIDPVGFAFQNFDLSGRWRDVEHDSYARGELDGRISWRGVGNTRPVDTVGRMPRGEEFKTFAEFRQLVVKEYQTDLVRGLMKNLMVYATGRKPDVDDLREVADMMKEREAKGYPLRDLLRAVVRSRAFLDPRDERRAIK
ncbi:MAG: DUF1592 domain-containing protein [Gemmataceae bacterium]|nr:DUF1592 domain-containing protein [Gemmataceae bacterium]